MGELKMLRKLGRYQVLKHLASGGMAQVLLARVTGIEGFERYVVIKQIHVERAKDETVVKMFLDEARMSASLHHNNIVQVHDIGQDDGEYFFAMEYVHGEDLRKLLNYVSRKHAQVPLEHLVTIMTAAASALHYAHDQTTPDRKPLHIVHRDVSPANILVAYDGTVKVVDFGIAKAAFRSTETQSGTLKGKISYMSPEQCMGQQVDRRSDVFALGIVLYELATVRRLFKGASDFLTMSTIVAGNIPPASTHRPDLPDEIDQIIMKALQLRPEDRYQTADELRVALDQFARKQGLRGSTSDLADYMHQVFGHRPEPWLVESDDVEIEVVAVDFDGAGSGAAPSPQSGSRSQTGIPTPPPGSLMARARRKRAPAGGVELTPIPGADGGPSSTSKSANPGWEASDKAPTTASGTPMAWAPADPAMSLKKRPSRLRLAIGIGMVAVLAGGGVAILQPWASDGAPAAPPTAAAPAASPAPRAEPPAQPLPVATAPAKPEEPAKPIASGPPAEPSEHVEVVKPSPPKKAAVKAAPPKRARVAIKKPKPKPDPANPPADKPHFDPNSLLPK